MASLQVLQRAHREVMALTRSDKGAFYDFLHKFKENPDSPGLRRKQLKGDARLWSARVNDSYRALLLHIGEQDYLVLSVKHRRDVYDNLDRYEYQINRVTGGIEVIDLTEVSDSFVGKVLPPAGAGSTGTPAVPAAQATPAGPATPVPPAGPVTAPAAATAPAVSASPVPAGGGGRPEPLFAGYTPQQLLDLGVAEPLLPSIFEIRDEDQLVSLAAIAPQLTGEVLLALYDGRSLDEVMEQVTAPVRADTPVDTDDFAAALARPATPVTSDDAALQAVIEQPFEQWQVFLHPTQRKLVDHPYRGPAKVGGGPGTGKTIVALHRVKYLVEQLPPGSDRPVLLTTYNRNLAADLRNRLMALGGPDLVARVDIVNIDKLASRVVAEAGVGERRRVINDDEAREQWEALLLQLGEQRFPADFLADEWSQVILGQVIDNRTGYFQARRAGRGKPLNREERDQIWTLVERFNQHLDEAKMWTWRQIAATAARLEANRATTGDHRYRHIVVDESQDLQAAHWKMLRAMVAEGPDDIFLVGDTHQRIYDNYVTLGSLGINVRGRSSRLTLSYRTTRQILGTALGLLSGETYDDLDGGTDTLAGYRSLLRGDPPAMRGVATWHDEQDLILDQVRAWTAIPGTSVAVCLPDNGMVADVLARLAAAGIPAAEIGPDGPRSPDGVHVGTMHRFKGLEYQRMIIGGVREGLVPYAGAEAHRHDAKRYRREIMRDRSRLFVAATRARDELVISWHGTPSRFLPER